MKKPDHMLLPAFMGTNVMTLFSYLVSELTKEDFSEPRQLSVMLKRLAPRMPRKWERIAGWGAHYAVGVLFAAVYTELWQSGRVRPALISGLIFGALSGAIAILIWRTTFKMHPLPPWINYQKFYLQLIPAHIIFAVTATIVYRLQTARQ